MTTQTNSLVFNLPAAVKLYIPKDYANYCAGDPVRVLDETFEKGLLIRWDATAVDFVAENGGVSYQTWAILGLRINRKERLMNWFICSLRIEILERGSADRNFGDSLVLLNSRSADEPLFNEVIKSLTAAEIPIGFLEEKK